MDRLADRLEAEPPPPPREASDILRLPDASLEDEPLDVPPGPGASDFDAFAEFEDELEGESTRIDDSHLLAEQSTAILQELPRQPFLEVEKGNDSGREFALQEGENGVGRGIDNDVILADVSVSRRHLRIDRVDGELTLRDLGSGNGTIVNGKRVSSMILSEGDRIEVGETVLVVRLPLGSAGLVDLTDPSGNTDESHVANSLPPPPPTPMSGATVPPPYQPELTPHGVQGGDPAPAKPALPLPRAAIFALLGGAALVLALAAALVAVLVVRAFRSEPSDVVVMADEGPFASGVSAYEAGQWDAAERAFSESIEEDPNNRTARRYLERVSRAREDEGRLREARRAIAAEDGDAAYSAASGIADEGPHSVARAALIEQARALQIAPHLAAAREALAGDDLDRARDELSRAANIDSSSVELAALRARLAVAGGDDGEGATARRQPEPREGSEEPRPSGAGSAPRRGGGSTRVASPSRGASSRGGSSSRQEMTREIIGHYAASRFDTAVRLARSAAQQGAGADRTHFQQLGERIERFKNLYLTIQRANFGPSVLSQMEQAIALDRSIARSQPHRERMQRSVVAAHLSAARSARTPVDRCRRVRTVLGLDSSNAVARQMSDQCESEARQMLARAQGMPPTQASATYGQIMQMVPANSPVAAQARQRSSDLRRRRVVDEDE